MIAPQSCSARRKLFLTTRVVSPYTTANGARPTHRACTTAIVAPHTARSRLVPATVYDLPLPYFLYAGLVFVPLTEPYLHEWGDDWMQDAPHALVHLTLSGASPRPNQCTFVLLMHRFVLIISGTRLH